MSNADIRGRFVWHELMTTDTKAAGAFYSKATTWKTQAWDKDPSYTLIVSASGPFGGLRTLPDAARAPGPYWVADNITPNLDADLQTAQRLGARVLMGATQIPDAGRYAVLADPQGAVVALFSPPAGAPEGAAGSMPQEFTWHELATTDAAAALSFYGELFGWKELRKHDMGAMGVYHLVGIHGVESIGMFKALPDRPMPTRWMSYAHVADIDKAASAVKAAGGKVEHGPMEVPGGTWIAHCVDPQGAAFALHADRRVAAAAPAAKPAAPKSVSAPPAPKPQPQTVKPAAPAVAVKSTPAAPTVSVAASPVARPPAASKPAATKAPARKAPAKKAAAKKAPAKKSAVKKAAKKAVAKKASAQKRAKGKSKTAAKKARKGSAKRKVVKKKATKAKRRSPPGGLEAARRFAVRQADSLLKRLRGKKHR
jgi:predicted enzyme related to lactoylglutathione lyase